jgi:hypothetical protein
MALEITNQLTSENATSRAGHLTWAAATDLEKRILIDELVESVTVSPIIWKISVSGGPRIHVLYQEVGLKESVFDRVGGRSDAKSDWRIRPWGP